MCSEGCGVPVIEGFCAEAAPARRPSSRARSDIAAMVETLPLPPVGGTMPQALDRVVLIDLTLSGEQRPHRLKCSYLEGPVAPASIVDVPCSSHVGASTALLKRPQNAPKTKQSS